MSAQNEKYLVTATGTKEGQPYSTLTRIVSGTKKNSTDTYCFIDSTRTIHEAEVMTVGAIVEYRTARVANAPAPTVHRATNN
jgi:hypothetical protein